MKHYQYAIALLLFFLFTANIFAQQRNGKYQGLLWEISKPGVQKPSYLFGTMHVSRKLAFQLSDSFYLGLKSVEMVALETNPETWQDDMDQYAKSNPIDDYSKMSFGAYTRIPSDYLSINTFKITPYQKQLEDALSSNPSTINNLLYRTYGNDYGDFEEDTYLDLYIYQCGKRLNKMVAGVERFEESMRLMNEAYKDASKDRTVKERSSDLEEQYSQGRLQEAYRSGNLDWVDSINLYNSTSAAFDEKFLYQRNIIQATSIDSIITSGRSLFVGVGAAHLPGERGVIEILRKKGYTVRAVKTSGRDRVHKDQLQELRVPVKFNAQTSTDGFFNVDIPGLFYTSEKPSGVQQWQHADMANGCYYMVSRVLTSAWAFNQSTSEVSKIIDSLLYENIPGKILQKKAIVKNGYNGFDITNRTRRGDIQRYQIFSTPFEVIIFKMSGTGEYVTKGDEALRFFNSIRLKESKAAAWKKFSPASGGFSISLPQMPFNNKGDNWSFDAQDKTTSTQFRIIRSDIHNYAFAGPDSFDLQLMNESFASSDFIDSLIESKPGKNTDGRAVLDCKYRGKQGDIFLTRYFISGPHYYTLIAHGRNETAQMKECLKSFQLQPFVYPKAEMRSDTSLKFTVNSPVFPKEPKPNRSPFATGYQDEVESSAIYSSKLIVNDTTGEKIFISSFRNSPYADYDGSPNADSDDESFESNREGDSLWIYKMRKAYKIANDWRVFETVATDTSSSRAIWDKIFYRQGSLFKLSSEISLLDSSSSFVKTFFDSFEPSDSLILKDSSKTGSSIYLADLLSADTIRHKKAVANMYAVNFKNKDLPELKMAFNQMNWKQKNYLEYKKGLMSKFENLNSTASSDFLNMLYQSAGDTLELQYAAINALAKQKTSYSYKLIGDIFTNEPPIIQSTNEYGTFTANNYSNPPIYGNQTFFAALKDSLKLTKTIIKAWLPLINLDGYKYPLMSLIADMVDSNLIKAKEYNSYYNEFLLEAKQELRKQIVTRKQAAIKKAEDEKNNDKGYSYYGMFSESQSFNLLLYAKLLLPFEAKKKTVTEFIDQLFREGENKLKYNLMIYCVQKNRSFPDSLLDFFAAKDEYRYSLYQDLKKEDKLPKFPLTYSNNVALGRSKILTASDNKIDSLVYLDRRTGNIKSGSGFVYFYKYREKKDDLSWKFATLGILQADTTQFEFINEEKLSDSGMELTSWTRNQSLTETRILDQMPLEDQIDKELKRLLYSKYPSGKMFYNTSTYNWNIFDQFRE